MIDIRVNGAVLTKEFRAPLPGLLVIPYIGNKKLLKNQKLTTNETGDFAFAVPLTKDLSYADFFEKLSFKIADESESAILYSTSLSAVFDQRGKTALEILIPQEVFKKVENKLDVRLFADDAVVDNAIPAGASLSLSARGLIPAKNYTAVVEANGRRVIFNDLRTSNRGRLEAAMIWPQAGINDPGSKALLTPEEAYKKWRGSSLKVALLDGKRPVFEQKIKITENTRPLIFATSKDGRPLNAIEGEEQALYISVFNPEFSGEARIMLVDRQQDWQVGDLFKTALGKNGKEVALNVKIAKNETVGTFRLARPGQLRPGAYDIVVRPLQYGFEDNDYTHLIRRDVLSARRLTGVVIRENFWRGKPVLGGCVNKVPISGRIVSGAPYFQYSDTFTLGENVWAGLDPGIVDPGNISKMCALYVIQSKDAAQWNANNSLTHLAVLGGNANVQKVMLQPGCMNVNTHLLWSNANIPGDYDIIADFGNNTSDPNTFTPDDQYNTPLDMIDGYFATGFKVVEDPGAMSQWAHAGTWHYDENIVNVLGLNGSPAITDESGGYFTPGAYTPVARTVRLKARVFYPADVSGVTDPAQISAVLPAYPLIVIVHGNGHNYTAYDFLLEHLARNGFIAASIDCRYLSNGSLVHGMHGLGRAEAFFKHLEVLFLKFGATAQNNIGIMGHSRGGEAVVKAARINQTSGLGYGLNAVMSLAPTDQYGSETLSGAWSKPYFVLYGSRDGDISGAIWTSGYTVPQTGFALWDRASGSEKSMAFVYLATHNGFITNNNDAISDGDVVANMLPVSTQQAIIRAYMTAFYRLALKNEPQWKGMFSGEWKPASVSATAAELFMQYQGLGTKIVDNFEGAVNWQASTIGGVVSSAGLPANPQEGKLRTLDGRSPHDSQGLTLRWDNTTDALEFAIPPAHKDVSAYAYLSIRITQKDGSASNPANQDQDLRVNLKDGANNERAVRVSPFARIPYPDQRPNASNRKSAMVTVRIPLKSYSIVCAGLPQLDLTNITTLALKFSQNSGGEIDVDSIEFTN
ncbi:MAG: hypothetical protein IPM81_21955 [Saprospirales bacterium]|nr:hypothetical protein [Saprospirales bacterium]